ncbi:hypothetical protein FZX15_16410 [Brucella suis bv. 1]|nr:hypothetical protein FZX15_16410 [Brucella suis bv. 1]
MEVFLPNQTSGCHVQPGVRLLAFKFGYKRLSKGYRAAASYSFLAMLHFGNKAKYWLKMG